MGLVAALPAALVLLTPLVLPFSLGVPEGLLSLAPGVSDAPNVKEGAPFDPELAKMFVTGAVLSCFFSEGG